MRTAWKHWTRRDEIEACTLRWLGWRFGDIAARLGRTFHATRFKVGSLLPLRKFRHGRGELTARVVKFHRRGLNDQEIANLIGVTRSTINMIRRRKKLPSNIGPSQRARLGGLARHGNKPKASRDLPECWACGLKCPTGNHVAKAGWHSRPMSGQPSVTEMYCGPCFRRWGWGELHQEGNHVGHESATSRAHSDQAPGRSVHLGASGADRPRESSAGI